MARSDGILAAARGRSRHSFASTVWPFIIRYLDEVTDIPTSSERAPLRNLIDASGQPDYG